MGGTRHGQCVTCVRWEGGEKEGKKEAVMLMTKRAEKRGGETGADTVGVEKLEWIVYDFAPTAVRGECWMGR